MKKLFILGFLFFTLVSCTNQNQNTLVTQESSSWTVEVFKNDYLKKYDLVKEEYKNNDYKNNEHNNATYTHSRFNKPVNNLPSSITHLIFGDNLPQFITHLTFGQNFNQEVNNLP